MVQTETDRWVIECLKVITSKWEPSEFNLYIDDSVENALVTRNFPRDYDAELRAGHSVEQCKETLRKAFALSSARPENYRLRNVTTGECVSINASGDTSPWCDKSDLVVVGGE